MTKNAFRSPSQPIRCRCWNPTAFEHDLDCPMRSARTARAPEAEIVRLATRRIRPSMMRRRVSRRGGASELEPHSWFDFLPRLRSYPWRP